jgi:hypothetical protein
LTRAAPGELHTPDAVAGTGEVMSAPENFLANRLSVRASRDLVIWQRLGEIKFI